MSGIHADVLAVLDERSSRLVADQMVRDIGDAGRRASEAWTAEMGRNTAAMQTLTDRMGAVMTQGMRQHGARAGQGFGDAFGSQMVRSIPVAGGFAAAMRGYESEAGKVGAVAGRAMGMAFTAAAGGLIGATAYTLFKGFERYEAIDAAKNRLENLNRTLASTGKAGIDVAAVMKTVNDVVLGTPFALNQAFSIATRALASNTGDLKRFMTDVADAAGFAGEPIDEIGQAFLKVANVGKVSMRELQNELRNLPIAPWLAETLHKSTPEITKMIHDDKIGLEDLLKTIEQHAPGFAKAAGNTVQGAMENLKISVARGGANLLGAIFGQPAEQGNQLVDVLKALEERIDHIGQWVTAHQNQIRDFFKNSGEVAKDLLGILGKIGEALANHKDLIYDVAGAYAGWKTIDGVASLITSLGTIRTALKGIPKDAAVATVALDSMGAGSGAGGAAGKGGGRVSRGLLGIMRGLPYVSSALAADDVLGINSGTFDPSQQGWGKAMFGQSWNWIFGGGGAGGGAGGKPPGAPSSRASGGRDQDVPPPVPGDGLHWEAGKGWVLDPNWVGLTPGLGEFVQPAGAPPAAGPAGAAIQDPTGTGGKAAPRIPYPAEYGQPPSAGETPEHWRGRMEVIQAQHDVAEKRARVDELEKSNTDDQNEIIKAKNDVIQAEIHQTETEQRLNQQKLQAVQVPYGPGFGAAPRLGQTEHQYSAEQSFYEAQHKSTQARAELRQVETSGTATTAQLTEAHNQLLKAQNEEYQSQLRLYDAYHKTSGKMDELGAKLDPDFGISKGLVGIAENLTKFIANLAAAPVLGALGAVSAVAGGKDATGSGIIGMIAGSMGYGGAGAGGGLGGLGGLAGRLPGALGGLPGVSGGGPFGAMGMLPGSGAGIPYGLPHGANSGGFGGGGVQFPDWVNQLGAAFGVKPSTYPGHQEGNRSEAGFAPNPQGLNRGIDWSGPVENMQRFADYLASMPGSLEQVIFQNPQTGRRTGIAGGQDVSQSGYYAGDYGEHTDHVHTRQAFSIPVPGAAGGGPAGAPGANWGAIAQRESSGNWQANTGNGYFGGLQFTQSSWETAGGTQYAARADLASPQQQQMAAERLLAIQGPGAWPNTFVPSHESGGGTQSTPGPISGGYYAIVHPNEWMLNPLGRSTVGDAFAASANRGILNPNLLPHFDNGGGGDGIGNYLSQLTAPPSPPPARTSEQLLLPGITPPGPSTPSTTDQLLLPPGLAPPGPPAAAPAAPGVQGPSRIGGAEAPHDSSGASAGGGSGGLPGAAVTAAASAIPGAGAAAQIGMQEMTRAIKAFGQYAGSATEGLMTTFLPLGGSQLAQNSWLTRLAGGFAQAAPALPNMAGKPASGPLSPEQAFGGPPTPFAPAAQNQGAQPGGVNVHIGELHVDKPETADKIVGDHTVASYAAGITGRR